MSEKIMMIQALKEFKILSDKINRKISEITEYSSGLDIQTPEFGTEAEQKKEVASLIQTSENLVKRYLWLKRCLGFSNAIYKIVIDGYSFSIVELLELNKGMSGTMQRVYDAANSKVADEQMKKLSSMTDDVNVKVTVKLYYDVKKMKNLSEKWEDFTSKISYNLEIFNATHELLDPETYYQKS